VRELAMESLEGKMFGEAEGVCVLGTRICIKSITKLVDLEVKYANRTPKGGIPAVTVNHLLVSLVSLVGLGWRF
jgi:hypothetical protein